MVTGAVGLETTDSTQVFAAMFKQYGSPTGGVQRALHDSETKFVLAGLMRSCIASILDA